MSEFEEPSQKDLDELMNFMEKLENDSDDVNYDKIIDLFGLDLKELEKEMNDYVPQIDLNYMKSHSDSKDPNYAYQSDSGFDLYSTEETRFQPFERKLVPTGLFFDIPDGYEIQVRTKSGLALKQGLMVLNSPGTVDQGYTGEIKVILMNMNNNVVTVEKGQKIAQAVLCPVVSGKWVKLVEVKKLDDKERSDNGFGSTGLV
jgi:dUTP pyrophosphatase